MRHGHLMIYIAHHVFSLSRFVRRPRRCCGGRWRRHQCRCRCCIDSRVFLIVVGATVLQFDGNLASTHCPIPHRTATTSTTAIGSCRIAVVHPPIDGGGALLGGRFRDVLDHLARHNGAAHNVIGPCRELVLLGWEQHAGVALHRDGGEGCTVHLMRHQIELGELRRHRRRVLRAHLLGQDEIIPGNVRTTGHVRCMGDREEEETQAERQQRGGIM
jgi:hypothetical protein